MRWKDIILQAAFVAACIGLCCLCGRRQERHPIAPDMPAKADTVRIVIRDTVTIDIAPAQVSVTPLPRYVIARLERTDTVRDTVEVRVPLSRYEYADSSVRVVASGYAVTIDSVRLYAPREIRTVTLTQTRRPRWAVGPSLTVGVNCRGQPTIALGLSVTYNLVK